MNRKRNIAVVCLLILVGTVSAQKWTTLFAYNHVTQIALTKDQVFALSDGNLYSVDKQTEHMHVYNRLSGLHSTGITCIHYDSQGDQLLIAYTNGMIDIMSPTGMKYVGELYDKDMTQRKDIYNVTIHDRMAYLSTHYGVQTMDLRENKMVDSYWLRPNGEETPVSDVLIANDSIYAFTSDSLFCASLQDNLVDYTYWKREIRSERVQPDTEKGVHYQDGSDNWYAGMAEGIVRYTQTSRVTYKPQGPLVNVPYRMRSQGTRLGIVQGGYDMAFYYRPGLVMVLKDGKWINFDSSYMKKHLNIGRNSLDYSDIIFDPVDPSRYFVSSFGFGLIEFRQDTFYHHYNHSNSLLEDEKYPYIWVDGLQFDSEGNLWMLNNCANGVKVLRKDGSWLAFSNAACKNLERSKDLFLSVSNPNIKIISSYTDGIGVFDDNGTWEDQSDDRAVLSKEFHDEWGNDIIPSRIYGAYQTQSGALLFGTDKGLLCIQSPETMLEDNRLCQVIHIDLPSEERLDIFSDEIVQCFTEDNQGKIWVGTMKTGLYCLSTDLTSVEQHFSIDNSAMPNNNVLSLAWMKDTYQLYVGTAEGLVVYDVYAQPTEDLEPNPDEPLDPGVMKQWRLHYSFSEPTEIASTPYRIFANSSGALFSVDIATERIEYWNKGTGLTGTTVSHIAYDESTNQLIIGYEDGRIDLLREDGVVRQMPDITLKASSMAVNINSITMGSQYAYLAMPFGIIAVNTQKAEVVATYYIGSDAASVDVKAVLEKGDSLYAFTDDGVYFASLKDDDLANYVYWHRSPLPTDDLSQVMLHQNEFYTLQRDTLYRYRSGVWQQVIKEPLEWIHASHGKLLLRRKTDGLWSLNGDDELEAVIEWYSPLDAVYRNGEYWMGIDGVGLVRLNAEGLQNFEPEGPLSNYGYHLRAAHDQVYVVPGGRWANPFARFIQLSISDGKQWRGYSGWDIAAKSKAVGFDAVSVAVDPRDKEHFFIATYGTGVFEFTPDGGITRYNQDNSSLRPLNSSIDPNYYTCTDGALMDNEGNLWVLNLTQIGQPLHVRTSAGMWKGIPLAIGGEPVVLDTPGEMIMDNRDSHKKWFVNQRVSPGVFLYDDGGTPTMTGDDRCVKRSSFTDQNGATLTPDYIYCIEQDYSNRLWIGTATGVIVIPSNVDFFTSDACRRIIIPRNDGTGLGDYLLGNEQINCMAVDGGNRMWIGTANSGLYLIEDDTITVAHFTEYNSLLPSNSIQSIAIMPSSGEVYVGTSKGIASYRSDASDPADDMKGVYAYPNPVRPDYGGVITITGLMDETDVNIIDAGGNLVCKTRSHGGIAVWNGKTADGKRATSGVYTALCNANGSRTVVKILVIR